MGDNSSIIGKPGPFQVIESLGCGDVDSPIDPPRRRYDCHNYDVCLDIATALNWDSYTCRGCSTEINQALLWRAHLAARKDTVAGSLCEHLPHIGILQQSSPTQTSPTQSSSTQCSTGEQSSKGTSPAESSELDKDNPPQRASAIEQA